MRHRWFLAMAILSAGCAPEITEGHFACERDGDCLTGWFCRADQRCWSTPGDRVDGGADDGGPGDGGANDGGAGDGGDAATDAGTDACVPAAPPVDLLVMVDNSNSMQEEQASLTTAFPELVRALVTGDVEPDGTVDFEPVSDLRVGVVSSDMGTGPFELPTCPGASFGDDGILQTEGNSAISGCGASYPAFLEFAPGGALAQFRQDFRCVATLGTTGCGFEQQLEAVLKAVTPSDSALRFEGDTLGHGGPDGANAGFLRDESLLVVLLVTDEDDCSVEDPELFSTTTGPYTGTGLNLRCGLHPEALHSFTRYVDGLRAVRVGHPERLVFAALTGVPPDIEEESYATILDDARMDVLEDPGMPGRLREACETTGAGRADPARRIVEAARELTTLGSPTMVRSICRPDFDAPLRQLLSIVGPRLSPVGCP